MPRARAAGDVCNAVIESGLMGERARATDELPGHVRRRHPAAVEAARQPEAPAAVTMPTIPLLPPLVRQGPSSFYVSAPPRSPEPEDDESETEFERTDPTEPLGEDECSHGQRPNKKRLSPTMVAKLAAVKAAGSPRECAREDPARAVGGSAVDVPSPYVLK